MTLLLLGIKVVCKRKNLRRYPISGRCAALIGEVDSKDVLIKEMVDHVHVLVVREWTGRTVN
jgi:hypothetical protein